MTRRTFSSSLLGMFLAGMAVSCGVCSAAENPHRAIVQKRVEAEYPSLFEFYKYLHAHPELSFQESRSAGRVAEELRRCGFEVTTGVGRQGVVAVFRNGVGPTVLVRTDLDALPVKENTGLPYASTVTATNAEGVVVPVMHACGHDLHMTCLVGTARVLTGMKDSWNGTLVFIGQPAEELGLGARAMLADGLYQRFPRPDFCLALHDNAQYPAGSIVYTPGFTFANVDSADLVVHGVGGHGAYPHTTKDPIVLAARIVLALQTIVSREVKPGEPAVITVGSIHGGTKYNVIPSDVHLQLTVRSYTDAVRNQLLEAIKRVARGEAAAAGIPENLMPEFKLAEGFTPATYNEPKLTERIVTVFKSWFGEQAVILKTPSMGGEDFSEFGRTAEKVPLFNFEVGGVDPVKYQESQRSGAALPSLHSAVWAPVVEPTMKTGITAMSAAVLELLGKGKS